MENRIKRYIKSMLSEGYGQAEELSNLATEIIKKFGESNYPMVNRIVRKLRSGGDIDDSIYFNYDIFGIKEVVEDPNAYRAIRDLVDSDARVIFRENIGSYGIYDGGNKGISIKYTNDFKETLLYNIDLYQNKLDEDGYFDSKMATSILRTAIGASFRDTIIHELRHAYDDLASKGKYTTSRKAIEYRARHSKNLNLYDKDFEMSYEQYMEYLNLPHELWARFSETVASKISGAMRRPFPEVAKKFASYFSGYDILSESDRRRLLKALYKYWSLKKDAEGRNSLR